MQPQSAPLAMVLQENNVDVECVECVIFYENDLGSDKGPTATLHVVCYLWHVWFGMFFTACALPRSYSKISYPIITVPWNVMLVIG